MQKIPLTQGQYALVDDSDYDYLMQWKWYARKGGNTYYAGRGTKGGRIIRMHRQILGLQDTKEPAIDHRDGYGLNNQSINIRVASRSTNVKNRYAQRLKITILPIGKFYSIRMVLPNNEVWNIGGYDNRIEAKVGMQSLFNRCE